MPQITVFNPQQQIIDCYIISDELHEELTRVASIFELNSLPISFLKELQSRFLNLLYRRFGSKSINLQVVQNFPWYLDLVILLENLHRLNTLDLTIELVSK